MSKQTTEELVKRLLNAEPGARQEAARVIEAMGVECQANRDRIPYPIDTDTEEYCEEYYRREKVYAQSRAATDEVIDLKTQEDGR